MWGEVAESLAESGLYGVVIGAAIALSGSFLGAWYSEFRRRRVQEKETVEFFLVVLQTISQMAVMLKNNEHKYEPIWVRLLVRVQNENAYLEQSRNQLIHIRDKKLRQDIAEVTVRLGLVTDGMREDAERIRVFEEQIETSEEPEKSRLQQKLDTQWGYRNNREPFFDMELDRLTDLVKRIEQLPIAH